MALPAFARRTQLLQQSIASPPGPQQQTRISDERTDRRRNRRTDTVPFHRPCSAYYEGSANDAYYNVCLIQITYMYTPIRNQTSTANRSENGSAWKRTYAHKDRRTFRKHISSCGPHDGRWTLKTRPILFLQWAISFFHLSLKCHIAKKSRWK